MNNKKLPTPQTFLISHSNSKKLTIDNKISEQTSKMAGDSLRTSTEEIRKHLVQTSLNLDLTKQRDMKP